MRNWNPSANFLSHKPITFSAYLWGIETSLPKKSRYLLESFQPTYEELKRKAKIRKKSILKRFQPTYEELKHDRSDFFTFRIIKFSAYLWGIETEGVKRLSAEKLLVFSLPMRNWNVSFQKRRCRMLEFSAYLWGIETKHGLPFYRSKDWFSAYLWGIETHHHNVQSWFQLVFSLPMRNWNPASACSCLFSSRFSAYLWGIETFTCREPTTPYIIGFQPTYEELKLAILAVITKVIQRFQPTYEELKLCYLYKPRLRVSGFQPTYEELKPLWTKQVEFVQ